MNEVLKTLLDRGFIKQCTDLEKLSNLMDEKKITMYIGADPTGSSLHIGHMVPIFALKHFADAGHRAVILIGGGTGRIGDPSGKTEMRKVLSYEQIDENVKNIKAQLSQFTSVDFANIPNVTFANNSEWLADLNFIDFMREIGSQFSVNKMLTYEAYKKRMETGLSFLEFTYQILQSYDFLTLHQKYACDLQIGGDDQWGNITAGVDLVRRKTGDEVYGLTFPLVTRADGKKMGKSEQGAIFLDPKLTSPYDFFQYFRNTDDRDVEKMLLTFTFLPIEEIKTLCQGNINVAKERLATEVTGLVHGKAEAKKALLAAKEAFYGKGSGDAMPSVKIASAECGEGISVIDLFVKAKLCSSKSEARRLIQQGGAFIDDENIADIKTILTIPESKELTLRAGKKRFMKVVFE
ncbi:MAG: tyrosine--tRNA ligase [Treponemataceae bacterium]